MNRIGKTFTFDAAHSLPLHDGKCRNLHGHTYRVEVVLSGPIIRLGPKSGMVFDFGDVTTIWKEKIEPLVDHQNLNVTLPIEHTTAEEIAYWIRTVFTANISVGGGLSAYVESVKVWETPTSWAEGS